MDHPDKRRTRERDSEDEDLVMDPAAKTQPAEGGREEATPGDSSGNDPQGPEKDRDPGRP